MLHSAILLAATWTVSTLSPAATATASAQEPPRENAPAEAAPTPNPDIPSPDQAIQGRLSRPATFHVDFRVAVTPPAHTKRLRVWLPLPPSDEIQQIRDRSLETFPRSVTPKIGTEPRFGNTFAYFEFQDPAGAQLIQHQFTATVHQVDWNVAYDQVEHPAVWPESFANYRRPDHRAAGSEALQEVMQQIKGSPPVSAVDLSGPQQLLASMRWVDQNLSYDHVAASLRADPLHALVHRRGHCSDYHGLCSTLAQEAGYPSRVVYGLHLFDKASPSHCKLELFLPPYGWVSFDLSETQKLAAEVAERSGWSEQAKKERITQIRERTRRGFRENRWLAVTRGTHYELAPPASSGTVPVVRTIYAEADGEPLPDPDPSNSQQRTFAWMTIYRVDGDGAAQPFDQWD